MTNKEIFKAQEKLGKYFVKHLGLLVEKTEKEGEKLKLSKEDSQAIIKTTIAVLNKLAG